MSGRTENGFVLGAIEVTALADWGRGSAAVGVKAGRTEFDVQASPKGQNVQIVMAEDFAAGWLTVRMPDGHEVNLHWSKRYGAFVSVHKDGHYVASIDAAKLRPAPVPAP